MSTRTMSLRFLLHGVCVSIVTVGFATAAHAVDPVTLMAAAGTAKEVAGKAKDFLEFIGYLPSQSDPMAGLPEKLGEIQAALDRIKETTAETLDLVRQVQEGQVLAENDAILNEYLNALQHVTEARITIAYLTENPQDPNLRRDADVASRLAIEDFEKRPRIFREVGPRITDRRFNHLLAYSGYLQAAAVRVAFIQVAHGAYGFTHEPYHTELQTTAQKLRTLVARIDRSLRIRVQVTGDRTPLTCTGAYLRLVDRILYDPVAAKNPANWTGKSIEFPGDTCDGAAIDFYLEEPINTLRAERAAQYGALEMAAVADQLDNYAAYGQPTPPVYSFPDWIMGARYSTANTFPFVPDGAAAPGVAVVLTAAANSQNWQMPLGDGPYVHMDSGLCLTATALAHALTLEVCNGRADQWWIRIGDLPWEAALQHQASGLCLSSIQTYIWDGIFGQYSTTGPSLHLAACDSARADQLWTTSDPTAPGPIVR
jgi:hypothetical protein